MRCPLPVALRDADRVATCQPAAVVFLGGTGGPSPSCGDAPPALFLTGIALLGVVTAAIASWFVERMTEVDDAERRTEAELAELLREVRALREELAEARRTAGGSA